MQIQELNIQLFLFEIIEFYRILELYSIFVMNLTNLYILPSSYQQLLIILLQNLKQIIGFFQQLFLSHLNLYNLKIKFLFTIKVVIF